MEKQESPLMNFNEFLDDIIDILDIRKPTIITTDNVKTGTRLGRLEFNSKNKKAKLYLDIEYESIYDKYFVTAHEMRHYWQLLNHPEMVENYIGRDDVESVPEYNSQIAEIDANAFALLMFWVLLEKQFSQPELNTPELNAQVLVIKEELIKSGKLERI